MASQPLLLRGGRVLRTGGARPERIDVAIGADGRVERLGQNLQASAGAKIIDLGDRLVSPGLVDCHQHLDKTRTLRDVPNPAGTLLGAVAAFNDYAARITPESLRKRADRTVSACLARGTVAIRTHANVDPVLRGRAVDMLVDLRERWRDRMRIQVVAFVTSGATRLGDTAKEWLESAIAAGADVIGGTPAISDKPESFMDMLFDAAERHGVDPLLVHAVIKVESGYNRFALSPKGAQGLMQLMPGTARQPLALPTVFASRQRVRRRRTTPSTRAARPNVANALSPRLSAVWQPQPPDTVGTASSVGDTVTSTREPALRSAPSCARRTKVSFVSAVTSGETKTRFAESLPSRATSGPATCDHM